MDDLVPVRIGYQYFPTHLSVHTIYPLFAAPPPPSYKLPKLLLALWIGFDFLLLATGIAYSTLFLAWMNVDPIHRMVLSSLNIFAGLTMGGAFITTFMLSVPVLLQIVALSSRRALPTRLLLYYVAMLFVDELLVIAAGAIVWWRTLQERNTFSVIFDSGSDAFRDSLQSKFDCCGYFTPCTSTDSVSLPVCVDPITAFADKILNIIFTSMFATTGILISLVLCSACLLSELKLLLRYRKIDEKNQKIADV